MVKEFDLGVVRGAPGPAGVGDMTAALYDPGNQRRDIFAYVDGCRVTAVGAELYSTDWNATTKQATIAVAGVMGSPRESKVLLSLKTTATTAQREAWRKALIYPVSQANGS
ncbi:MAG: hypothetical protein RR051_04735, partial [Clostridiales bacterium]